MTGTTVAPSAPSTTSVTRQATAAAVAPLPLASGDTGEIRSAVEAFCEAHWDPDLTVSQW